ncbi:trans-aconitate 2-methyltransferase [Bauldia litoralis]|uniref:Trans-aconitate 2-methyltransferase n=1 Tax=Bauldia litoralis TaxID=665467 RepID=A0A1G6D2Q0_9HYPH|nr:trans-aconitate 2-methyltransferase [Bauldia litoralis]SDB39319.1 trans-aconitate 2-methyltransferase [Bauldia litoralis]
MTWSPAQYLKFEDERSRPAAELLARVPLDAPKRIVDVGCGPGNSTALLAARYPDATLVGLDTSPDMLAAARKRLPKAAFIEASVATWVPDASFDLIFGNAVFQWVPDHLGVLARLLESCQPGGVLAIQVPDNLGEPTHRLMADVALAGPWRNRFEAPVAREAIPTADAYYDRLRPLAASIDIWRVTYHHVLDGPEAIVEWLKGTGLLPYLERLEAGEREAYLADYLERIAASHPPLVDGKVLLRFPRLFVVATRG